MFIHFSIKFSLYSEILLFVHDDMFVIVCGRQLLYLALFAFLDDAAQHGRVSYLATSAVCVKR